MADTRKRIAVAARGLFERHGIEAVSMRRVARKVGVTAPAIYRHYEGRQELLEEITAAGLEMLRGRLEEALVPPGTPLERILRLFDGYLDFAIESPEYFDFLFLERRPNVLRMSELRRPGGPPTAMLLAVEVEAAMRVGELARDDVGETCIALWGHSHGLIAFFRAGRFGDDVEGFRSIYRRSLHRLVQGLAA